MFNEKSPLQPGQGPQPYVFTSPQRMYKKKVKQLQCYLCGIVVALFGLALLCAVLFSVDEEEILNDGGNGTDRTPVLYMKTPNGDQSNSMTLGKTDPSSPVQKFYTSGTVTSGQVTGRWGDNPPVDLFTGELPATIHLDSILDQSAWGSSSQIKWSGVVVGNNSLSGTFVIPAKIGNETKDWTGNFSLSLAFKWSGNLDIIEPKKQYDCKVLFVNYKKTSDVVLKRATPSNAETCTILLSGSFYEPSFVCYITPWWCTKEKLFYWNGGVEMKVTKPLPLPISPDSLKQISEPVETKFLTSVSSGMVNVVDSITGEKTQWKGDFPVDIPQSIWKPAPAYPLTITWRASVTLTSLQGTFKLPTTNGVEWKSGDFTLQFNSSEWMNKLTDGATYTSPVYLHDSSNGPFINYHQPENSGKLDEISIVVLGKHTNNSFSSNGKIIVIFKETPLENIPLRKFVLQSTSAKVLGSVKSGWLKLTDSITGIQSNWNGALPVDINMSVLAKPGLLTASWSCSNLVSTVDGSFKLNSIDAEFSFEINSLTAPLDMIHPGITYESPVFFHDSHEDLSSLPSFPAVTSEFTVSVVLLGSRSGSVFSWDGQFILIFRPSPPLNLLKSPETKIAATVESGWLTVTDSTGMKNQIWGGKVPADISLSLFSSISPFRVNWTSSVFHTAIKGSFKFQNKKNLVQGDFSFQVNSYGAGIAGYIIPGVTYESPVYLHDPHGQNFSALIPRNPSDGTPGDQVALVLLGKRSSKKFSWNGQFVAVFSQLPIESKPILHFSLKTQPNKVIGSVNSGWLTVTDSITGGKMQVWSGTLPQEISLSVFMMKTSGYPLNATWSCSVFHNTIQGSFKYPRSMSGINGWIDGEFMFQVNSSVGLAESVVPGVSYESPIYLHDSKGQNFSYIPGVDSPNGQPGNKIVIVLLGKREGTSFFWNGQFVIRINDTPSLPKLTMSQKERINYIPSVIADWSLGSKILGKASSGWLSYTTDSGSSQTVWNGEIPANITLPVFWTSDTGTVNVSSPYSNAITWSCSAFQSSIRGSFKLPQHTANGLVKWLRGEFYVQLKPNPEWSFYDIFVPGVNYISPIHFRDSASLDIDSLLVPYRAHSEPGSEAYGLKAPVILLGKRTKSMFSWNGSFIALVSAPGQ